MFNERATASDAAAFVPLLRTQEAGETRVLGVFSAVECDPKAITLVVNVDGVPLRLSAARFEDVDFVSYRQEASRGVTCGAVTPPQRALATYRRAAQPNAASAGTVVAVELLPDGYTPP